MDPWIITAREKLKYQEQFESLIPQGGFVTGGQAKGFFLQSQLPPLILGQIWALADTDSDGKMNILEFSIACKLINLKLRGLEIPKSLPPSLLSSLSVTVSSTPNLTPTGTASLSPLEQTKGLATTVKPEVPPPPASATASRHASISERTASIDSTQGDWAIKSSAKLKYTQFFNTTDRNRTGFLNGNQARSILVQSKLPQATLAQIWTLSDLDCDGRLSCDEFVLAMFLCDKAINGEKIPVVLPADWIPPSFRKGKSRQGSISGPGSRPGSIPSSRHASVSSQGAVDSDPAAGLPLSNHTFEDKRKENFDKGQAELDRRRKLLQDQQRKEREERDRKEREEADKREKARLEAERKQQEELERQLQKQRELELEKEEQRKRELDAKEAARKELEKQRQQEWEQTRIAEMNTQKQREQERVLKQKALNTQLNVELSTLNEKIKDLSQKICDTRAGVTNVKSVIDGMRSQRDTSMSEMASLKARIKEQNTKLLQLTQERGKWDAKARAAGADTEQQEQMNAAFASKQLLIKQLRDKVENIGQEIESKKEDINSNDVQMAEVKGELSALIQKCEELYTDYDAKRTEVLEIKYNKRNENVSVTATSAWDSSTSANWNTEAPTTWSTTNTSTAINQLPQETAITTATTIDSSGPAPEGFNKYRAVYEFSARNADEITFVPGDIIYVPLEQNAEPGWLAGEINGHTGWFPETYVEKIDDEYTAAAVEENPVISTDYETYSAKQSREVVVEETAAISVADTKISDVPSYYIAAYPYDSAESGDLNFSAGEMVLVIKKEGDWWTGTIGQRTGMFPSNYVQKAEMGTAPTAIETTDFESQMENSGHKRNVDPTAYATEVIAEKSSHNIQISKIMQQEQQPKDTNISAISPTMPAVDETHTNEDLDTEVSQINTQSKSHTEPAESYSRPMSRTSSMTPGMRAKRSEIAQVIAPYEATSTEQLSLTRGQLIMIRKKTDSGWWEGELQAKGRRRQIGWFPATYVKVLQGGRNSGRNTPVSGSRIEMTEQILDKVIALYPYKAQNDDELSFEKDDIISVLGRDEPEWWRGELNGLSGLFPSNYVGPFVTSGKQANGSTASVKDKK